MYALLRLMKRPCGAAGLRDRATEYWEIATSCRPALMAVSPRPSTLPEQRRVNIHHTVRQVTHREPIVLVHRVRLPALPIRPPLGGNTR